MGPCGSLIREPAACIAAPDGTSRELAVPADGDTAWTVGRGAAFDAADNLWFGVAGADGWHLARMKPDESFEIEPDAQSAAMGEFAAAADGSVWFTRDDGTVGRVDADGQVRSFSVPGLVGFVGLAGGADGQMWFAGYAQDQNMIGHISPDGAMATINVTPVQRDCINDFIGDNAGGFYLAISNEVVHLDSAGNFASDLVGGNDAN